MATERGTLWLLRGESRRVESSRSRSLRSSPERSRRARCETCGAATALVLDGVRLEELAFAVCEPTSFVTVATTS